MSDLTLACRICGSVYDLPAGENHRPCPACGTENCRPQMEADVGDTLRRATAQRLRCDFKHAEDSYQYILKTSPDEHEALWGLVQCRYAVEYVKDPRTGKLMPIVHAVQKRPMLTDPDFREACDLAPEAICAQYRQEAEYIDGAMARIRELAATGDAYDVFLCHKTTRTDGEEGYTEDFKRATQLYMKLEKAGYRVFFAPFAGLTAGDNYEAGIYHAIATAKVMLVVCSNQDYINSPWVRTEWQRFLEMSYEPGADKHLIPLLYEGFPSRRLPDDFRQLQAIAMDELDATERLMNAVARHVGRSVAAPVPAPQPVRSALAPDPAPVGEGLVPSRPAPQLTPVYAPESDFETEAVDGGVAITGYSGPGGEVLIPPTIGGKRVVEIGKNAFKEQEKLTKVVIPEGVTSIRIFAFNDCRNLTSVSIPASVTNLESNPFANCQALTSTAVAAGNEKYYVRDGVLMSRDNLLVCYPAGLTARSYTIPAGVTSIGYSAFWNCSSLTSVSIPESVTSIGSGAFLYCSSLTSVSIPESVTSIGEKAFSDCSSLTLRVHPNTPAHAYVQKSNLRFELIAPAPQPVRPTPAPAPVGEGLVPSRPAPQLTPVYAPESHFETESVDGGVAITGYSGPGGEVLIPPMIGGKRVVEIGESAFEEQEKLTKVVIPEGVTSIGKCAFASCSSLTSASIPASVTELGLNPFLRCEALMEISVATGNKRYYFRDNVLISRDNELVCYPAGLTSSSYTIPAGVTSIGENAFTHCSSLKRVNIPKGVTSIRDSAFLGCNLTSVSIPEGVTSIGEYAFFSCDLTSVNIPDTVTSIGDSAFMCCSNLKSVHIPNSVTSIGNRTFYICSNLTSVSIPNGVASIGESAFYNCSSLTSVNIPDSVTSIGDNAFSGCPDLSLRFNAGSVAHTYAQKHGYAMTSPSPQSVQPTPQPTPQYQEKPSLFSRLFGKK